MAGKGRASHRVKTQSLNPAIQPGPTTRQQSIIEKALGKSLVEVDNARNPFSEHDLQDEQDVGDANIADLFKTQSVESTSTANHSPSLLQPNMCNAPTSSRPTHISIMDDQSTNLLLNSSTPTAQGPMSIAINQANIQVELADAIELRGILRKRVQRQSIIESNMAIWTAMTNARPSKPSQLQLESMGACFDEISGAAEEYQQLSDIVMTKVDMIFPSEADIQKEIEKSTRIIHECKTWRIKATHKIRDMRVAIEVENQKSYQKSYSLPTISAQNKSTPIVTGIRNFDDTNRNLMNNPIEDEDDDDYQEEYLSNDGCTHKCKDADKHNSYHPNQGTDFQASDPFKFSKFQHTDSNRAVHGSQNYQQTSRETNPFQFHSDSSADKPDKSDNNNNQQVISRHGDSRNHESESTTPLQDSSNRRFIKLPPIVIPDFYGDPTEWENFIDMFMANVHNFSGITDAVRLTFLKNHLKGTASSILDCVKPTDANYKRALELCIARFSNPRIIVKRHLRNLANLKPITEEAEFPLLQLVDSTKLALFCMQQQGIKTEYWDAVVIMFITDRIPEIMRRDWERENSGTHLLELESLYNFLTTRARSCSNYGSHYSLDKQEFSGKRSSNRNQYQGNYSGTGGNTGEGGAGFVKQTKCTQCGGKCKHLDQCQQFIDLEQKLKFSSCKKGNHCFNCLFPGHRAPECRKPPQCKVQGCTGKHHTMLHFVKVSGVGAGQRGGGGDYKGDNVPDGSLTNTAQFSGNAAQLNFSVSAQTDAIEYVDPGWDPITQGESDSESEDINEQTIVQAYSIMTNPGRLPTENVIPVLPTIKVRMDDKNGSPIVVRCLLDTGSHANFCTEYIAQRLGVKRAKVTATVKTMGGGVQQVTQGLISVDISSTNDSDQTSIHVETLVMQHLTGQNPPARIKIDNVASIESLTLADQNFYEPERIDMLFGITLTNYLCTNDSFWYEGLKYQSTRFGWIASGCAEIDQRYSRRPVTVNAAPGYRLCTEELASNVTNIIDVSRFWEIEDIPAPFDLKTVQSMQKGENAPKLYTADEQCAVDHFMKNHVVLSDGRIMVELPYKKTDKKLGDSSWLAKKRFYNLEKFRLSKNSEEKKQYCEFMREFQKLGHMVPVPIEKLNLEPCDVYHMGHHYVLKDSTTTALRVVIDGSMLTSSGYSLNDILMKGPKLQADTMEQLLKFRKHKFVLCGDISKMYRQVVLNDEGRNRHRLFWRENPEDELILYEMCVVMYGIISSSYQAIQALQLSAQNTDYVRAAQAILDEMYVDDLMTGDESKELLGKLREEVQKALATRGFNIRKWSSNVPELIAALPEELREDKEAFSIEDKDHAVKALGMKWFPHTDCFAFAVEHIDLGVTKSKKPRDYITKREMLSDTSKIYDPLGLVGPIVVQLKLIMQESWMLKIDWDKPLPQNIADSFMSFRKKLVDLRTVRIPRWVLPESKCDIAQLHVFCDASEKVYGACIYVRAGSAEKIQVRLLCAKTKVAPLVRQSIARLELCAMVLGAQLVCAILPMLAKVGFVPDDIWGWTDSAVALCWVNGHSRQLQTFVGNRVSQIHQCMAGKHWHHVGTSDNPADVATRGIQPSELAESNLWWQGPEWLVEFIMPVQPLYTSAVDEAVEKERKTEPIVCMFITADVNAYVTEGLITDTIEPMYTFSCNACTGPTTALDNSKKAIKEIAKEASDKSIKDKENKRNSQKYPVFPPDELFSLVKVSRLGKVARFAGLILSFVGSFKRYKKPNTLFGGKVTYETLPNAVPHKKGKPIVRNQPKKLYFRIKAVEFLVRREQRKYFSQEIKIIVWDMNHRESDKDISKKQVSKTSRLSPLYPFIDKDDLLLKVGGRLAHADYLPESSRYQTIVPADSLIATLILRQAHFKCMHGGVMVTMGFIRTQYWIVGLKNLVRSHVSKCITCHRYNSKRTDQLMADLPAERVTPSAPFTCTGLDFSSAIPIKMGKEKTYAYMCVFVCFSTKAIHIEAVSRMDTESCSAALRRFVARRGAPVKLFSDNGTNFTGSRNEMLRLADALTKENDPKSLENYCLTLGIKWALIPPASPHWGGLWEAGVKQAKYHFRKCVGRNILTYEEFNTLIIEVESMLNTRPLCELTDDPTDVSALTPGMLLNAKQQMFLPHPPSTEIRGVIPPESDKPGYLKIRWQFIQNIRSNWWSRWTTEYLPSLQVRHKWQKERVDLKVGDLVLVTDDYVKNFRWPLGRVLKVYTGTDNRVRTVQIKTQVGVYTRPVVKLRKLPLE